MTDAQAILFALLMTYAAFMTMPRTFIGGVDTTQLSDEQIFQLIARKENEVKAWETINARPKKLQARIDAAKTSIHYALAKASAASETSRVLWHKAITTAASAWAFPWHRPSGWRK